MTRPEVREEIRTQVPAVMKPELDAIKTKVDDIHTEQIRQGADLKHMGEQLDRLLQQP